MSGFELRRKSFRRDVFGLWIFGKNFVPGPSGCHEQLIPWIQASDGWRVISAVGSSFWFDWCSGLKPPEGLPSYGVSVASNAAFHIGIMEVYFQLLYKFLFAQD